MIYHPSLSEKKERLRQLQQALNGTAVQVQQVTCAVLLAELRWETQEIKDVETEVRALRT